MMRIRDPRGLLASWGRAPGAGLLGLPGACVTRLAPRGRARRLALASGLILVGGGVLAPPSAAQQPVQTWPAPGTTAGASASGVIGTGGTTFQLLFAATGVNLAGVQIPPRKACTIQNNGTHTMWISEGTTALLATQAKSVQLGPGQVYYCNNSGGVLIGEVDITGTSGEAFYAAQE